MYLPFLEIYFLIQINFIIHSRGVTVTFPVLSSNRCIKIRNGISCWFDIFWRHKRRRYCSISTDHRVTQSHILRGQTSTFGQLSGHAPDVHILCYTFRLIIRLRWSNPNTNFRSYIFVQLQPELIEYIK